VWEREAYECAMDLWSGTLRDSEVPIWDLQEVGVGRVSVEMENFGSDEEDVPRLLLPSTPLLQGGGSERELLVQREDEVELVREPVGTLTVASAWEELGWMAYLCTARGWKSAANKARAGRHGTVSDLNEQLAMLSMRSSRAPERSQIYKPRRMQERTRAGRDCRLSKLVKGTELNFKDLAARLEEACQMQSERELRTTQEHICTFSEAGPSISHAGSSARQNVHRAVAQGPHAMAPSKPKDEPQ